MVPRALQASSTVNIEVTETCAFLVSVYFLRYDPNIPDHSASASALLLPWLSRAVAAWKNMPRELSHAPGVERQCANMESTWSSCGGGAHGFGARLK